MKIGRITVCLTILSTLVLTSCKKGGDTPETDRTITLQAVFAEQPVRVDLSDAGVLTWSAGDQIAVWDAVSSEYKTFTNRGEGGASVTFSFTGEPGVDYEFSRAVYPASIVKESGRFDSALTLPAEYSLEEASELTVFPLIASVQDDELHFKHLGAAIDISVEGIPEAARTLVLSSSQVSLSGDFSITDRPLEEGKTPADAEDMTVEEDSPFTRSAQTDYEIQAGAGSASVTVDISTRADGSVNVLLPLPVGVYPYTITLLDEARNAIWSKPTLSQKEIRRANLYGTATASATLSGGSGTSGNPFLIASAADLLTFQTLTASGEAYRSAHYRLTADIDMGEAGGFTPVGGASTETAFAGELDGDGYAIRNLSVSTASNAGLFSYLTGTVRNLRIEDATITSGGNCAGTVAAILQGGTINACASHANVSAAQSAGGIVGSISSGGLVINCVYEPVYQDGKMAGACIGTTAADARMGGIAGEVDGSRIVNCYAYPLELASSQSASTAISNVGGIAGRADGASTVHNCISPVTYSNVLRSGTRLDAKTFGDLPSAAAIVGGVYASGCSVTRCYSKMTWRKTFGNPDAVSVTSTGSNHVLGDTNMRGWGTDMTASLNAVAAQWNSSESTAALDWTYYGTFGYPKPLGVDAAGIATKKVSLMGDSISTYLGYMFSDIGLTMNKWYPDSDNTYPGQILNEQETWWWKLIYGKMTNARLEAANAYSGSTVSYLEGRSEPSANTYCFQKRALQYGFGVPDILFYYGGRNDFGSYGGSSDVYLGSYGEESLSTAWNSAAGTLFDNFSQGTVAILRDFHAGNPGAKVLLIVHDQMSDGYASAAGAVTSFLFGKGIDIRMVNLHKTGTRNATNTDIGVTKEGGTHPNSEGATNIANYVWAQVGSWLDE